MWDGLDATVKMIKHPKMTKAMQKFNELFQDNKQKLGESTQKVFE